MNLRDVVAIGSIWLLVAIGFWRILLAGRVLAGGDLFTYFYPYWAEATRALRSGRIPLWNPYLFAGSPHLANSQSGLLYPLNWVLWRALPAHRSVHVSPVLHVGLGATGLYVWTRLSLGTREVGAWTAGIVLALGGYLGAQLEHVNQVQGLAWMPWALLLCDRSFINGRSVSAWSAAAFAGLCAVIGLALLAGHLQSAFVVLSGVGLHVSASGALRALGSKKLADAVRPIALLAGATALGIGLAGAQLLPTWQLSKLSIRADGLPFNERVSFSLSPLHLPRALLPGYSLPVPPDRLEHVAYIAISGLAIAAVGAACRRRARPQASTPILFVGVGIFLALGRYNPVYLLLARYVPGFAHFRVPARWLALYAMGAAILCGFGIETVLERRSCGRLRGPVSIVGAIVALSAAAYAIPAVTGHGRVALATLAIWLAVAFVTLALLLAGRHVPRAAATGLIVLLVSELLAASRSLPHARATASQAYTSLRPAAAHLRASGPGRFLSMSDITFDPGDLAELSVLYGPQLDRDSLYELVIATKEQEVLSPNLPLVHRVPAIDGYDGGVLPLGTYAHLQALLSGTDRVSMDGRLRENLRSVPQARWLNMLNVRYVLTDKLGDAWLDDVFYDLEFGATLSQGSAVAVAEVPSFEATALGMVSSLSAAAGVAEEDKVAEITILFDDAEAASFWLWSDEFGRKAMGEGSGLPANAGGDSLVTAGAGDARGLVTRLHWGGARIPVSISVRSVLAGGEFKIEGMSLIDERMGSFQSLVIWDQARVRRVYSGDVKIYENLDALGEAYLVHDALVAQDDDEALAAMASPEFDPGAVVVLHTHEAAGAIDAPQGAPAGCADECVRILLSRPELLHLTTTTCSAGYLVVSRAWYPGWEAWVDGEAAPLWRANMLLGAVPLDAGRHTVTYAFRPTTVRAGVAVTVVSLVCLSAVCVLAVRCSATKRMV